MAPDEAPIRVHRDGGCIHIGFTDTEIVDEGVIQRIGEAIGSLIGLEAQPRLVIDFSNVRLLSSTMLGVLITLHNQTNSKHGQFRLAGLDPRLQQVLAVTQLDTLFSIYPTAEQASADIT